MYQVFRSSNVATNDRLSVVVCVFISVLEVWICHFNWWRCIWHCDRILLFLLCHVLMWFCVISKSVTCIYFYRLSHTECVLVRLKCVPVRLMCVPVRLNLNVIYSKHLNDSIVLLHGCVQSQGAQQSTPTSTRLSQFVAMWPQPNVDHIALIEYEYMNLRE